ncbi:MAG: hypothetical protein JNK25_14830 [Phycisphaerae bacterium]|nr:hypothetical protein [Phycisphaerae bacterium]
MISYRTSMVRFLSFGALAVCLASGTAAAMQPERSRPAGQPPGRMEEGRRPHRENPPQDEAGLRRMIQRRLEQLGREAQRLERAMKRLDDGVPPAEVAEELGPPRSGPEGEGDALGKGPERGLDRGGPPDRPGERGAERPFVSREEREELIAALREHAPLMARRMESARTDEPGQALRMLGRLAPRLRDAMAFRKSDPDMFRLKIKDIEAGGVVFDAMQTYHKALRDKQVDDAEVARALTDVRAALLAQFDARLAVQVREADNLARRLEGMRKDFAARREARDSEVQGIIDRLMEGEELFRDRPPSGGGPPGEPRRRPE